MAFPERPNLPVVYRLDGPRDSTPFQTRHIRKLAAANGDGTFMEIWESFQYNHMVQEEDNPDALGLQATGLLKIFSLSFGQLNFFSLLDVLSQRLPAYTYSRSSDTSSSTDYNDYFDKFHVTGGNVATGRATALVDCDEFQELSKQINGIYQTRELYTIDFEADGSDASFRDLLTPCEQALNSWKSQKRIHGVDSIHFRPQWTSWYKDENGTRNRHLSRVDHAITVMIGQVEKCVVIIELKRPGDINFSALDSLFKKRTEFSIESIEDDSHSWRAHLGQLIKYRETWDCDEVFFTDTVVHIAMIIEVIRDANFGEKHNAEGGPLRQVRYWQAEKPEKAKKDTKTREDDDNPKTTLKENPSARETLLYLAYRGLKRLGVID